MNTNLRKQREHLESFISDLGGVVNDIDEVDLQIEEGDLINANRSRKTLYLVMGGMVLVVLVITIIVLMRR